jgi:formate hydrogenlyase subunit 6/NADH:ubiquinone oxidoreductase subunit I
MLGVVAAVLTGSAAAELIPTPSFSNHAVPTTRVPVADDVIWPLVDVAILALALGLATYLALVKRSRRGLVALTVASMLWFGFWRQGCVCPIGATQNVALAACDSSYVLPVSVLAFFLLPLVVTLFFGRTFCAAVCPLGAVQELAAVRPLQVPRWLDHALGLIPYLYLGVAVMFAATGTGFIVCRYDPFVAFFRLGGNTPMIVFGGCLLLLGIFVGRPYCRYLCPYGAILRVLAKFSKWRVHITPSECINCRLCEHVCPYGAIEPTTVEQPAAARARGRRRLQVMLALAPVLILTFGGLGTLLATPLSQWHATVRLAEQVRAEELGVNAPPSDAAEAFRTSGQPASELYQSALGLRDRFFWLGGALGAWTGLVVSAKLIHLSVRRRRAGFQADRAGCVSCGRCYWYCPVEQVRLGWIAQPADAVAAQVNAETPKEMSA